MKRTSQATEFAPESCTREQLAAMTSEQRRAIINHLQQEIEEILSRQLSTSRVPNSTHLFQN